jgi:hypothetical protein
MNGHRVSVNDVYPVNGNGPEVLLSEMGRHQREYRADVRGRDSADAAIDAGLARRRGTRLRERQRSKHEENEQNREACHTPNENKMSDGGQGRASLGVKVWKSSQM